MIIHMARLPRPIVPPARPIARQTNQNVRDICSSVDQLQQSSHRNYSVQACGGYQRDPARDCSIFSKQVNNKPQIRN